MSRKSNRGSKTPNEKVEKKEQPKQVKMEQPKEIKKNFVPMVSFTVYKLIQIPLHHSDYCTLIGKCSCTFHMSGFNVDSEGNLINKKHKRVPGTLHCVPGQKYTIPKQLFNSTSQLQQAQQIGKLVCH